MDEELRYKIATTMFKGVSPMLINSLVEHTGSLESFFRGKKLDLNKISSLNEFRPCVIDTEDALMKADKEIDFCLRNDIRIISSDEPTYPYRLKQCPDAPQILYCKGDISFNNEKVLAMVGTRRATLYGRNACNDIVKGLKEKGHDVVIVSGLAYGIDVASHKAALDNDLRTIGVVAHGLNQLYPAAHKNIARRMVEEGGAVLSDFSTLAFAEPRNFLKRNRIVAGLSDAVVVVESAHKGGSMITASLANDYDRDVLALPGKSSDKYSSGCNLLIKEQRASLIENAEDIEYFLGWESIKEENRQLDIPLFDMNAEEKLVYEYIDKIGKTMINDISLYTNMSISKLSGILLSLELKNMLYSLPGNMYSTAP